MILRPSGLAMQATRKERVQPDKYSAYMVCAVKMNSHPLLCVFSYDRDRLEGSQQFAQLTANDQWTVPPMCNVRDPKACQVPTLRLTRRAIGPCCMLRYPTQEGPKRKGVYLSWPHGFQSASGSGSFSAPRELPLAWHVLICQAQSLIHCW